MALAGRQSDAPDVLRTSVKILLTGIAFVSYGNFNSELVGSKGFGNLQQAIAVALWLMLIACAFFARQRSVRLIEGCASILLPLLFYAMISPAWSSEPLPGLAKSTALGITTVGAWCAFSLLGLRQVLLASMNALFALAACSIVLVFVDPAVAVSHSWLHEGLWSGIFEVKQELGTNCAFLVLLGIMFCSYEFTLYHAMVLLTAITCVIGSGSRGGGIIAILSFVCILASRRSRLLAQIVATIPLIVLGVAAVLITVLVHSGLTYYSVFGTDIDLTERTVIWAHALTNWQDRPFLGFGLNGFWTMEDIYMAFFKERHWVLDNFHSGYVAILTETGLVGFLLSASVTTLVTAGLYRRVNQARRADRAFRFGTEASLGLLVLLFVINLTETIFMRSTNYMQILFDFALFEVLTTRERAVSPASEAAPASGRNVLPHEPVGAR